MTLVLVLAPPLHSSAWRAGRGKGRGKGTFGGRVSEHPATFASRPVRQNPVPCSAVPRDARPHSLAKKEITMTKSHHKVTGADTVAATGPGTDAGTVADTVADTGTDADTVADTAAAREIAPFLT